MRYTMAVAVLLAACGTTPEPVRNPEREIAEAKHALPAGTVVEILPCSVDEAGQKIDPRVVDGLLREALRQSAKLDFAGATEACPADWRLVVTVDETSRRLTTSLVAGADQERIAPIPLGVASLDGHDLHIAIDELAATSRAALGDHDTGARRLGDVYSSSIPCVRLTEHALADLASGRIVEARALLERARRADGGCTITLAALANAMLDTGDHKGAARLTKQTLQHFETRTAPTTRLRLARTLLLARAAGSGRKETRSLDQQLLALGEAARIERPHDPHARYTHALALNYLGRFAEARRELEILLVRWPNVGLVGYHLAFAQLALGDARAARATTAAVRGRLSTSAMLLPTALALYHVGETDELRTLLEDMLERSLPAAQIHELYRMLASLEILTGNRAAAVRVLLEDLDWLRRHAFLLEHRANDLAEAGEVLLQLDAADALASRIEAIEPMTYNQAGASQALAYLSGLLLVHGGEATPTTAIATLDRGRRTVWSALLRAAGHRSRGELVDETRELATAIRLTDAALVHARLSWSLRELGRHDQATQLMRELREKLLQLDLRAPLRHPLLSPARALAFAATPD